MAEVTPLLSDIDDNIDSNSGELGGQTDVPGKGTSASAYFERLIKILVIVTLISSALAVVLLIANHIVIIQLPSEYYNWYTREASSALGIVIFVALVFSSINVIINFPIYLNVIVDVVLAPFIIRRAFRLLDAFPNSYWCNNARRYPQPGFPNPNPGIPDPECERLKPFVTILMAIVTGLAGIIGVIYLFLLLLRSIAIFKTQFWKGLSWTFPTGKISLEISLKILKQPQSGALE